MEMHGPSTLAFLNVCQNIETSISIPSLVAAVCKQHRECLLNCQVVNGTANCEGGYNIKYGYFTPGAFTVIKCVVTPSVLQASALETTNALRNAVYSMTEMIGLC